MASPKSYGGARPKEEKQTEYGSFLLELMDCLTIDDILPLMTVLEFKPAERDKVEQSGDPGREFVHLMRRKGIINRTSISILTEKLRFCGLHGVVEDVYDSFYRYQTQRPQSSSSSEEYDTQRLQRSFSQEYDTHRSQPSFSKQGKKLHFVRELKKIFTPKKQFIGSQKHKTKHKKLQFVTELKNRYRNLCGGIQPAPFLRDRYDIGKLFVEGGIEFLEDEQGEKWSKLENYRMVFTDPRIKSKRCIIHGEPGYGKSTLVLQITHDWCQEKTPMAGFEILILLRLRQFRNVPSIYSAIKKFLLPKDSKLTEDDIKSILDRATAIILLDGYDEYPDRENKCSDIQYIIRGDMFQEYEVVLTTRTSYLPPKSPNTTKRIRLIGFDDAARETYIRNVVAGGSSDDANKVSQFLKENPVHADFCKSPLFFTMISYMVKNSERFRNLQTVTQLFRLIIKCFHSHQKTKATEENREQELDHSELDKVSYESCVNKISWEKANLRVKIGKDLYDEYVRIGILIEEDVFNYDTLEYKTDTRFFHKLFAEWFAAHYFAKVAAHPGPTFGPWMNQRALTGESPSDPSCSYRLKSPDPHDVHYMYRFACGLNRDAALKIIRHLGRNTYYNQCTLLCIREWGGRLEEIWSTVFQLCLRTIYISDTDSFLVQKSTLELIKFASIKKLHISSVRLWDCLDSSSLSEGNLRVKSTDLYLPVMTTLKKLEIYEYGREITEEETAGIFRYSAMCLKLKELQFKTHS
ncbi:NLR family CARD domain-containing protein 4 [Holothuria leucospilota]|uniref:NLR family CARD domain-containing protein 4 n=1 Tax=Holothuria leucospilota TaxID=206669 RepID=A0A9Q1BM76_HOLLE|nr:NLR family CARD domain-containing protein 4 [Holothuria leucospilota]